MFESSSKTGSVVIEDRWFGNAFRIFEATDANDLEAAIVVFTWRNAYWERRRRAECSLRHISWDERWKIGWLLRLEHSKSKRCNFETNSVAKRKPMQIRKDRCDVAEPRFLCDNSSKSILETLKASQIWNGCASQERVAEIKSGGGQPLLQLWFKKPQ